MANINLSVSMGEKKVKGEIVFFRINEIGVKMTQPEFDHSVYSPHIPVMALQVRRYKEDDGSPTDFCFSMALRMLAGLYDCYLFVEKNKHKIDYSVNEFIKSVEERNTNDHSKIESLKEERRELKKKLKSDAIDPKEYQNNVTALKREITDVEYKLKDYFQLKLKYILDKNFSFSLSCYEKGYIKCRAFERMKYLKKST